MVKKFLSTTAAVAVLTAFAAMPSTDAVALPFTVTPSEVDPDSGVSSFQADEMTGGFSAVVQVDESGSFAETGLIDVGNFKFEDSSLAARDTGLGVGYDLFTLFRAEGQVTSLTTDGSGNVTDFTVSFSDFLGEFWADPLDGDTTSTFEASGAGNDPGDTEFLGFTGQDSSSQFTDAGSSAGHSLTNTSDDVLVLSVTMDDFLRGSALGANLGTSDAQGSFRVTSDFGLFTDFIDFDSLLSAIKLEATGQFGSTTNFELLDDGSIKNARFNNTSANITFIPEPQTVGLLGLSLVGLGLAARRRRRTGEVD